MRFNPGFNIAYSIVSFAFHFWFSIKIAGKENLPEGDGFIVASNHRTYADPPMVNVCIKRRFCFIAKKALFKNKFFAWLISTLGAIPSTSDDPNYDVIDRAIYEMKTNKRCVCIFPEGTRHRDGKVGRGHSGVVVMAAKTDSPIVPVGIAYKGNLHFRKRIEFRIGKPLRVEDFGCDKNSDTKQLRPMRNKIMEDITFLANADNKYEDYGKYLSQENEQSK